MLDPVTIFTGVVIAVKAAGRVVKPHREVSRAKEAGYDTPPTHYGVTMTEDDYEAFLSSLSEEQQEQFLRSTEKSTYIREGAHA